MEETRKSSKTYKKGLDQAGEYHRLQSYAQPAVSGVYAVESSNLHRQFELERTYQVAKRGLVENEVLSKPNTATMPPWFTPESFSMRDGLQDALKVIETTKQSAQAASDWFSKLARLFEGQMYLRNGDIDNAMRLARELVDFDAPVDIEFSIFYPLCIEALIATREFDKALQIIDQILILLKDSNSRYKTNVLVLRAWACQSNGNEEEAISTLGTALQCAETKYDLFPFINNLQYIEKILEKQEAKNLMNQMLTRMFIIQQAEDEDQSCEDLENLIEPLTERELETLRLLNSHLPTPEIADILALSVNTVRTHIKSIYAKLGVHSRSTAIDVSKKLKLLA